MKKFYFPNKLKDQPHRKEMCEGIEKIINSRPENIEHWDKEKKEKYLLKEQDEIDMLIDVSLITVLSQLPPQMVDYIEAKYQYSNKNNNSFGNNIGDHIDDYNKSNS